MKVYEAVISFVINEDAQTVRILCISYAGSDWMSEVPKRL
jgi:toxin ParE1/3/4